MPIIMKSIFEPGEYEKIPDDDIGYIVSLIEDGDYMVELSQDKKISLKSLTMKIRAEKDPKKRNDLKLKLPCFNMGMFEGKCKNDNFKYSYYLIYDIDNIPTDKIMDDVKKILKKYVNGSVNLQKKSQIAATSLESGLAKYDLTVDSVNINGSNVTNSFASGLKNISGS